MPELAPDLSSANVAKLSATDLERVCRGAIAAVNGHDPDTNEVTGNSGDIVQIRYARASDGKIFNNECRVAGNRVIWRTVEAFGPRSGKGRWRTAPMDEVITYAIEGPKVSVTITYSDVSTSTKTYDIPG